MGAVLFNSRKMQAAKEELGKWEQIENASFPLKARQNPALIPLNEALDCLERAKELTTLRIAVSPYTTLGLQKIALMYAIRRDLKIQTRSKEGWLYIQNVPRK